MTGADLPMEETLPPAADFPAWILVKARELSPRACKRLILAVHEADETTESRDDQDLAWLAEASAALSPVAVRLLVCLTGEPSA